ncbi:ADP-ribosylglycohydrolase family protein [Kocuria palustris]|uniref:ADP-ribosylglycohydrolase family protein n=1 Tax=Kocuria palustris TaxID=71999 RepID=UPI0011A2F6CD|nr:ADP-ribosylglycohydrolase family protein [Kocuria palustris]
MTDSPAPDLLPADHGPAGDLPGLAERVRATMLGGALADALALSARADGADGEGGAGAARDAAAAGPDAATAAGEDRPLRIGADTQLSLYTMDGLLEAIEWAAAGEAADETACQWLAQLRWLRTQDVEWPEQAPSPLPRWIDDRAVLHADRGHQGQTLEALRTGMMGEVERPVLPEADDRTVAVRSIPYGLLPVGWRSIAPLTIDAAAITHGDAEAQTASTALALTLQAAAAAGCRGEPQPVRAAAEAALSVLDRLTRPSQRTAQLLREAVDDEAPEHAAGQDDGSAPAAVARGVRAALHAEERGVDPEEQWESAVTAALGGDAGRERTCAPVAGSLTAAALGAAALPEARLARLDAREVIEEAARRWVEGLGITG